MVRCCIVKNLDPCDAGWGMRRRQGRIQLGRHAALVASAVGTVHDIVGEVGRIPWSCSVLGLERYCRGLPKS